MRLVLFLLLSTVAIVTQGQSLDSLVSFSPDSIVSPYERKLDSIQRNFYAKSENLKSTFKQKLSMLDSSRKKMQSKTDSLQPLQLSEMYEQHLDSITKQGENLVASVNQRMKNLKAKAIGSVKQLNLPPQLQEKASTVTKSIDGFRLPVKDLNISSLDLPGNPLANLDGLMSDFDSPLGNMGTIDGFQSIPENLGDVSKITAPLDGYREDLQNITQGNLAQVKQLPQALEEKAADLSGASAIVKQTETLEPLLDAAKNPGALQEQAVEQIQEAAVDHFAGKETQLQEAMEKISKLKKKYSSLNSLSEIPKKRPNEMRGKPFVERLLPGIGIQLLRKSDDFLTDFNPYAGYRFTPGFTSGLGWNQRVPYNFKKGTYIHHEAVFGPRLFSECTLGKGFTPRMEVEVMSAYVPVVAPGSLDVQTRQWVFGAFIGVKKDYRFMKNVKGTAMMMLSVFNHNHRSPYADVLNVRFGLEFPMKKKQKKS